MASGGVARGTDGLVAAPSFGAVEPLLHLLETVNPVVLLEAVVSAKFGTPCLADIDAPKKPPTHRLTCKEFVQICYDMASNSNFFAAVETKLAEWKKIDPRYEFLEAKDIIGVMFLYSAETPIRFYTLMSAPFHTT